MATPRRRWSVRVGAIAGIELRVHVSMLLLVWLLIVADETGDPIGTLVWVGLIFVCVVLHELAHSLVARRVGVQVREIELLPIGGISKMDRIPDNPTNELAIAISGPLMSATIAVTALAATAATVGLRPPDLYGGALAPRIGWFNLFIAGFNLVPALPLDGGRVLRAYLERRVGPYEATRRAAEMGRWMAYVFIVLGAMVNLFLMIIGVFVYVASRAEMIGSVVHHELEGVRVADVMIHGPITLTDTATVHDVERVITMTAQRQFPITDAGGTYLGLIDAGDLARFEPSNHLGSLAVRLPAVAPSDAIESSGLLEGTSEAVAVVDGGRVVGLVRSADVVGLAQRAIRHLVE